MALLLLPLHQPAQNDTPSNQHRVSLLKTPTAANTPHSAAQETLGATEYGSGFWEEDDDQEQHITGLRVEL